MSRSQVFLFVFLLTISLILLVLSQNADLVISTNASTVILFPVRAVSNYFQYLAVSQKKIDELETRLSTLQIENQNLRNILSTSALPDTLVRGNFRLMKANIIGRDPSNFNGFLYIDKGETDGLTINSPAIVQEKVVGRVKALSEHTGIIETLENAGFAISAVDSRTGIHGIVKKNSLLRFEYIRIEDDIRELDSVFTSGLSEIFPKGILIGLVADIKYRDDLFFKEVIVTPAVRINQLDYVYVIY